MGDNIGTDFEGKAIYTNSYKREARCYKNFINLHSLEKDILQESEKRFIAKNVKARTNVGLQNRDKEIYIKRNKLRKLLTDEEKRNSQELDEKEKFMQNQKMRAEKEKTVLLELEKNKLEEEHLAKKKLELDMTKCREIKPIIAKRREEEARLVQQLQIKEKEKLKNHEKNIEKMWHDLMIEDANMRKKIEDDRSAEVLKNKAQLKTFLDSQVQLSKELRKKQYLEEKEREYELSVEAEKRLILNQTEEKAKKKQSKIMLGNELMQQMNIAKESLEKTKEQVKTFSSCEKYKAVERQKLQEKAMLRKEVDLFNKHLVTIKNHHKIREDTHETLIVKTVGEGNKHHNEHRELLKKKQKDFIKDIISERDKQLDEKRRQMIVLNEQKKIEIKRRIENEKKINEINQMEQEVENNKKKMYRKLLDDQIHAALQRKMVERERLKLEEQNLQLEEQKLKEKCLDLLNKEFNTESLHPFAATIKKHSQTGSNWYAYVPETKYFKY